MILKYHVSPSAEALAKQDLVALFTSNKAAMYYGASWDPATIAQVPSALKTTGIVPLPNGPAGRPFVGPGLGDCIAAKTKHQSEAWSFVQFLGTMQAANIMANSGAGISAHKGADAGYIKSVPQLDLKVFIDQLPSATKYPTSLHTSAWQSDIAAGITKVLSGQQSVEAACKAIAKQMNAELAGEG
jgi:multiple sugar transport system substrate-binding protein